MRYKVPQGRLGKKKKGTFGDKKPFTGKNKNRKGRKVLGIKVDDLKLRPKAVKEPAYTTWFHEVYQPPCFVCGGVMGIQFHHIKEHSSDERIDSIGMPLCYEHHYGTELSPHGTPTRFRKRFPMDVQYRSAALMYKKFKDR